MELFRVHAYSVSPQRGAEHPIPPEGGAVAISAEFQRIVDENLQSARLESRTIVDFERTRSPAQVQLATLSCSTRSGNLRMRTRLHLLSGAVSLLLWTCGQRRACSWQLYFMTVIVAP